MLMKKNLMPAMEVNKLVDQEGNDVLMSMEARVYNDRVYLFLSDTNQLGASVLAKDAMHYIEQLINRYQLDPETTEFYRHIYQETMGSLFGRFVVDWNNGQDPSYRFQMLTNVDDMVGVTRVLADAEVIEIATLHKQRVAV